MPWLCNEGQLDSARNCKWQAFPVIREGTQHKQTCNCSVQFSSQLLETPEGILWLCCGMPADWLIGYVVGPTEQLSFLLSPCISPHSVSEAMSIQYTWRINFILFKRVRLSILYFTVVKWIWNSGIEQCQAKMAWMKGLSFHIFREKLQIYIWLV